MMAMAYCDYIAHTIIKPSLEVDSKSNQGLMASVGHIKMDVHKEGWMQTTTKTIEVEDINGNEYRITIEQI